jgi:hypothetical protein
VTLSMCSNWWSFCSFFDAISFLMPEAIALPSSTLNWSKGFDTNTLLIILLFAGHLALRGVIEQERNRTPDRDNLHLTRQ